MSMSLPAIHKKLILPNKAKVIARGRNFGMLVQAWLALTKITITITTNNHLV
jgi:hypothetical protein